MDQHEAGHEPTVRWVCFMDRIAFRYPKREDDTVACPRCGSEHIAPLDVDHPSFVDYERLEEEVIDASSDLDDESAQIVRFTDVVLHLNLNAVEDLSEDEDESIDPLHSLDLETIATVEGAIRDCDKRAELSANMSGRLDESEDGAAVDGGYRACAASAGSGRGASDGAPPAAPAANVVDEAVNQQLLDMYNDVFDRVRSLVKVQWEDVHATDDIVASSSECCICAEKFVVGSPVKLIRLGCDHVLHRSCGMEWLVNHPSCPLCRRAVEPRTSSTRAGERTSGGGGGGGGGQEGRSTGLSPDAQVTLAHIVGLMGAASPSPPTSSGSQSPSSSPGRSSPSPDFSLFE